MATDFLNGVETKEQKVSSTVADVNKSIIGIVGTAPTFMLDNEYKTLNKLCPIRNYNDIIRYAGRDIGGFTLPDALKTILDESGGATIYMVNVFDENKHKTSVSNQTVTPVGNKININKIGINDIVLMNGQVEGIQGEDFLVAESLTECIIELLSEDFKTAESLSLSYTYADTTLVTTSDIVGEVNEESVTGLKLLNKVNAEFGDSVGIIIVPEYSAEPVVRNEIEKLEENLKAYAFLDTKKDLSINDVINSRNRELNNSNLISTSSHSMIVYPYLKRYNEDLDKISLKPASPVAAGMRVKLDRNRTIAKSITNTKTVTTLGLETPIEFILNNPSSESNALNASGVSTFINYKGGYYLWGARSCNFPSESGINTLESARRTADFIEQSIEDASFPAIGENIDTNYIEGILEMINSSFKTWSTPKNPQRLILSGEAFYDSSINSAEDLANGHIKFSYKFCPLGVAERITYYAYIDINIFTDVLGGE